MNDIIALLQISEIDVEQRTRGLRMFGLETARPLNLVAAKYFGIGQYDQTGTVRNKSTAQCAELRYQPIGRRKILEAVFFADFFEPLPFAFVIADHLHRITLPRPTMKLCEKLTTLRLRDLWIGRLLDDRPIGIQTPEIQLHPSADWLVPSPGG